MDLHLYGKVMLVAASSTGLGYGVARALAREGAVVMIGSRDAGRTTDAVRRLYAETGHEVLGHPLDVTDPASIDAWVGTALERFGGVDGLVTNSGGPPAGTFDRFDDAAWQAAFDLLIMSAVRLTRGVLPSMRARGGGSILMLTSTSVKEPIENLLLSNVMRSGVTSLAKSLSRTLAADRIRVNTLMTGRIATDRIAALDQLGADAHGITVDEQRARMEAGIPLRRYGTPDEFGHAAAFLLSDAASYLTGVSLAIDGGMLHTVW
jgi:3-oxoacyl-[acyl-carrier protein] reductase